MTPLYMLYLGLPVLVYTFDIAGQRWPPNVMTMIVDVRSSGPRLNIKTVFPRYGDPHVKDKTVGETVLSVTWESLYW